LRRHGGDCSSLVQMETPLLCGVMARELKRRVGYDLDKVYFCSTGAEGVETAIKFARRATGKTASSMPPRPFTA
jgi:ornithine--oxo-acid transaminase